MCEGLSRAQFRSKCVRWLIIMSINNDCGHVIFKSAVEFIRRIWSCRDATDGSRPISDVKQVMARPFLVWGTAWEYQVLSTCCFLIRHLRFFYGATLTVIHNAAQYYKPHA